MHLNVLVLGDVVGKEGCGFIRKKLPAIKKLKGIDFCIANGENSAAGNGILPSSAQDLFDSGVDFITTGNHVFRRAEIYEFLDERNDIIRPANYYDDNPGKGYAIVDFGRVRVGVVNLIGQFALDDADNPFRVIDTVLENLKDLNVIIVDMHAEATAEKKAMGYYLDGKVSAVFGTHTHIQTADEEIFENGTGYITDVGMCGTIDSVLGVKKERIIEKFKYHLPVKFEPASDSECMINGCIFVIDEKSGKTIEIERLRVV